MNCTLLWFLLVFWPMASAVPEVQLGSGTITGLETQVGESTVWKFLGIRFGQAPIGPRRFSKPVPAPLPTGTVDASQFAPACPAVTEFLPAETNDEDCLFLNVFVPRADGNGGARETRLPVMAWIYGGGFCAGNANAYDAEVLAADGDVIVVTFNYRIGPFGFLSTGDNSSVGNYGLWDQNLALKWVKDNIRHFGGDDTKITLFGESAGAASVGFHIISPHSAGLFHRAVLQSGTHLAPWARPSIPPLEYAVRLGRALNCSTDADVADTDSVDTQQLVECVRGKSMSEIVTASSGLWTDNVMRDMLDYRWLPVDDDDFVPASEQIVKFPGQIMLGLNNNEGGFFLSEVFRVGSAYTDLQQKIHRRDYYVSQYLPFMVQMSYADEAKSANAQSIKDAAKLLECTYRTPTSSDTHVTNTELERAYGDQQFFVNAMQFLQEEPNTENVYLYYFNHFPNASYGENGMNHAADLPFTFGFAAGLGQAMGYPDDVSEVDLKLSADFRTMLTNFAKTGNPNQPVQLPNWPSWAPYTKGEQSYLSLSPSPEVMSRLREDSMAAWLEGVPTLLRAGQLDKREWNACLDRTSSGARVVKNWPFFFIVSVTVAMHWFITHYMFM